MKKTVLAFALVAALFSFNTYAGDMPSPGYTCPPPDEICLMGDMPSPGYNCPELPPQCSNSVSAAGSDEDESEPGLLDSFFGLFSF